MLFLKLFVRRIVGIFRWLFGRAKARKLLKELKKVDVGAYVSRIVSDAVLMNQVPSPSENEKFRMDFVQRRLSEFGVSNIEVDKYGNVAALFPAFGAMGDFVLLVAEVGDGDYTPLGSSVRLTEDRAYGSGLGERSLGAAALLVLAEFAQATGFHFEKNLLVLFTKSGSVEESESGFRAFLDTWAKRLSCAIVVRGTGLGTLETRQVGSCRMSVSVRTPEYELMAPGSATSAAAVLGSIAAQIGNIGWDDKHTCLVNIARLEAGSGYGHWTNEGFMDIEIVSEDERMLETIKTVVTGTIAKASSVPGAEVKNTVHSRHSVGDATRNAPFVDALKTALQAVSVKPQAGIISELVAMLNERGVPAAAVGMTVGGHEKTEDYVELDPLVKGFRQLVLFVDACSTLHGRAGTEVP